MDVMVVVVLHVLVVVDVVVVPLVVVVLEEVVVDPAIMDNGTSTFAYPASDIMPVALPVPPVYGIHVPFRQMLTGPDSEDTETLAPFGHANFRM
jgi:hypothetical protein